MKKILTLLSVVLFTLAVSAQVDFSGTWKLNTTKSKLNDQFSFAPKEIIIVQKGNDMSVEKHSDWQGQAFTISDKYTLDGKECTNAGFMDTQKKSVLTWENNKKALKIASKIPMQDETMTVTEIYRMENGNLVIESSASSSYGDMSETQVYEKQ